MLRIQIMAGRILPPTVITGAQSEPDSNRDHRGHFMYSYRNLSFTISAVMTT